jgi:hypothetical protein
MYRNFRKKGRHANTYYNYSCWTAGSPSCHWLKVRI